MNKGALSKMEPKGHGRAWLNGRRARAMFWVVIIAVWLVCLAVFLELVRRAPLMEETEHGLVYVDLHPHPTQPSTKAARLHAPQPHPGESMGRGLGMAPCVD